MASGLCKDCKWWNVSYQFVEEGLGICELAETFNLDPIFPKSLAHALNPEAGFGDRDSAHLVTKPDFGCNQHEPRT